MKRESSKHLAKMNIEQQDTLQHCPWGNTKQSKPWSYQNQSRPLINMWLLEFPEQRSIVLDYQFHAYKMFNRFILKNTIIKLFNDYKTFYLFLKFQIDNAIEE